MTQVKNSGQELEVIRGGVSTYYNYSSFKTISWFQANNGNYVVVINFLTDAGGNVPLRISLNEVDNQPGWTNDPIGVANAVKDIAAFSGATIENIEALVASINGTLTSILATLQNSSDWEAYIVKDSDTPSVLWLEVRTYDPSTSTWSIEYFLPGSTTPGSPVLPVIYESPNSLLALMLAELVAQTASLSNIDTSTAGILSELQGTLDVLVTNGAGASAVNIQDGGNSITVDGTVGLDAPTLSALENITVQNPGGASAVNIQDGGNSITVDDGGGSITVDGTVTALPSGTQDVNIVSGITLEVNLDQNNDQVQVYGSDLTAPIATDASGHLQVDILTIPEVEIKNDVGNPIPISDAGGSITVDGSVTVSATDLDIRDLVFATDKVDVSGSSNVAVTDGGGSLTVDGTVTANQGTSPWVIGDGGGSITVDGTVSATQSGTWNINNITGTVSLPTGAATETTLALVNSNTVLGNLTLSGIDTKLTSVVRTPNLLRATGSGTIAPVVYDFSVANVGAANGTILGGTIKPGETLNFSAGTLNNSYAAASIAYDGTGTELVIIYNS